MAEDTAVLAKSEGESIGESNTTPNSIQEVAIIVPCYQNLKLKKGDNDKNKIWGSATQGDAGTWVKDLQQDLSDFGVYIGKLDGDFGKGTEEALKRFQWNALNIKRRLVNNVSVEVETSFKGSITGEMDDETCTEIKLWRNAKYVSTGNLVRVLISSFSNFTRGSMKQLRPKEFTADEIEIDRDFYDGLTALNAAASTNSIIYSINHVMRVNGVALTSTVVKPAAKSQHLVGHGIDGNMLDGSTNMGKPDFAAGKETQNAKNFVEAAKAAGLRWGGDFDERGGKSYDPIHFDLQVPADSDAYDYKFFFNQRQMSLEQPVPAL